MCVVDKIGPTRDYQTVLTKESWTGLVVWGRRIIATTHSFVYHQYRAILGDTRWIMVAFSRYCKSTGASLG